MKDEITFVVTLSDDEKRKQFSGWDCPALKILGAEIKEIRDKDGLIHNDKYQVRKDIHGIEWKSAGELPDTIYVFIRLTKELVSKIWRFFSLIAGFSSIISLFIAAYTLTDPIQNYNINPEVEQRNSRATFGSNQLIKHISATSFLLDEKHIDVINENKNIHFEINRIERRDNDNYSYEDYIYTMVFIKDFVLDKSGNCNIEVSARIINTRNGEICDKKDIARVIEAPDLWKSDKSIKNIIDIAKRNYGLTDGSYLLTDRWAFDEKCYNNEEYKFQLEFYDKNDGKYAMSTFPIELINASTRK
jgi:hypothetical protein